MAKGRYRAAGKPDANQAAIVEALRACGCGVLSLAGMGGGVPDLLVWCPNKPEFVEVIGRFGISPDPGIVILMEVKNGSKPPSARKLGKLQQEWHDNWPGPVYVVTSVAEALAVAGVEVK